MHCDYCDESAAVAVEKDQVKVGLCERHFRERIEQLQEDGWLAALQDELDIDG
jgi:hypothetical protein